MRLSRHLVALSLAVGSLGVIAGPAAAGPCQDNCPPCTTETVENACRKLTGGDLFMCPK